MSAPLAAGRYFGSPLQRLETGCVRVVESRYENGTICPPHSHANAHFCLVLEGGYRERIGRREREGLLPLTDAPRPARARSERGGGGATAPSRLRVLLLLVVMLQLAFLYTYSKRC